MMKIIKTSLNDAIVVEPKVFEDSRGFFSETWNKTEFEENGILNNWVQDNHAKSQYGVIRGLHYQNGEYAQAKLVRVTHGAVIDIIADLRKDSSTYLQSYSIVLSAENKKQLYVPRGFAHGYSVITKEAEFLYKVDNVYNKESEGGINPVKSGIVNVDWNIPEKLMLLSEKDKNAPNVENAEYYF